MAALDFPNSPSNGDTYSANGLTYTYNSSSTKWVRTSPSVGAQGAQGHQGHQGAAGAQGAQGATAAAGAQGNQGHQGDDGAGGSAGAQGNQGYQGAGGTAGAQGHQGSAGSATLTNVQNNRVMTAVSGTTLNAEANLEFDGSTLTVGGGGAFTGNIDLNSDTNKLKLGAGDDFQFWHNGSSNFIWTNSGPINIQSTQSSGTNGYISFTSGGTTERLRIESTGHSYFKESVGIQTADITGANIANPVGAGHSLIGLYIGDGSLMFSSALSRTGGYYISTDINALNAGPVTLNSNMKIDGTWVIV